MLQQKLVEVEGLFASVLEKALCTSSLSAGEYVAWSPESMDSVVVCVMGAGPLVLEYKDVLCWK